ncbi:hypothetical protein ACTWPT_55915 [Nonomuraea sp. 3N208]|uniref:hypothetical protein n=1 Tax=Nonomuraea sp. 3N208 TaxID=3457421 RepID=UPI003FD384EB
MALDLAATRLLAVIRGTDTRRPAGSGGDLDAQRGRRDELSLLESLQPGDNFASTSCEKGTA